MTDGFTWPPTRLAPGSELTVPIGGRRHRFSLGAVDGYLNATLSIEAEGSPAVSMLVVVYGCPMHLVVGESTGQLWSSRELIQLPLIPGTPPAICFDEDVWLPIPVAGGWLVVGEIALLLVIGREVTDRIGLDVVQRIAWDGDLLTVVDAWGVGLRVRCDNARLVVVDDWREAAATVIEGPDSVVGRAEIHAW